MPSGDKRIAPEGIDFRGLVIESEFGLLVLSNMVELYMGSKNKRRHQHHRPAARVKLHL